MKGKWTVIKGSKSILLVASHAYPQIRKNNIKPADVGTGQLVELLCDTTGAWGIISTDIQLDPNWYVDSPFREKTKELIKNNNIKYVLDIHGKRENYRYLLEMLPNRLFNKIAKSISNNFHLADFVDNEQLTLAEDLENDNIACAEIEIRKDGRLKEINEKNYNIVIKESVKLIQRLVGK